MREKSPLRGTALVTGGAKRIGRAISLMLSSYGFNVALHFDRSRKEASEVQSLIKQQGRHCEIFHGDLAVEKQVLALIDNVKKNFDNLNLLINNASVFQPSNLSDLNSSLFDQHMAVNLKAPLLLTSQFSKFCRSGQIINILDTNCVKNKTRYLTYLLSKKGLLELTKLSAVELAPRIRVNGIAPGFILPAVNRKSGAIKDLSKIPLKKKGDIHHVTISIKFLLENDYVTGQILFSDGGEHLV